LVDRLRVRIERRGGGKSIVGADFDHALERVIAGVGWTLTVRLTRPRRLKRARG